MDERDKQNLAGAEDQGLGQMQANTDGQKSAGLDSNQANPTQNSQATSKAAAGPSGSGPNNQTYNQPPSDESYTPATHYSPPFADSQHNYGAVAPVTDVVGQPIGDHDSPEAGNIDGLRHED